MLQRESRLTPRPSEQRRHQGGECSLLQREGLVDAQALVGVGRARIVAHAPLLVPVLVVALEDRKPQQRVPHVAAKAGVDLLAGEALHVGATVSVALEQLLLRLGRALAQLLERVGVERARLPPERRLHRIGLAAVVHRVEVAGRLLVLGPEPPGVRVVPYHRKAR